MYTHETPAEEEGEKDKEVVNVLLRMDVKDEEEEMIKGATTTKQQ